MNKIHDKMKKISTDEFTEIEQLIISSAREVFSRKGFHGTRMHEIAELAGINKALLHYYFRNKKKLFEKVFEKVQSELLESLFNQEINANSIEESIKIFADNYTDFFLKNQFIPQFLIQELNENPDWIIDKFTKVRLKETLLMKSFLSSLNKINQSVSSFYEPMLNLISMLLFPIIARPVIQKLLEMTDEDYDNMILERKKSIPELVIKSMKLKGGK